METQADGKQTRTQEKIDVLDFIINALYEHEKNLDNLIGRLEILLLEMDRKSRAEKV